MEITKYLCQLHYNQIFNQNRLSFVIYKQFFFFFYFGAFAEMLFL